MASGQLQRQGTIRVKEANVRDPKVRADLYMQTHGIKELFEGLGTQLLFHRPENPRAFIAQHLAEMRSAKQAQSHVPFFEESDLDAMFSAFDVTGRGYITLLQYDQALLNLGIEQPTLRLADSISAVDRNMFIRSLTQELKNASSSFM